ncbi:hypothetical protein [Guptibacillus algicola]|uniref:hypothetical protein n=1 Tax=Guptibacillus algicola TaxID=225844 RepID=UPI001CD80FC7|nr:hypothetical protein [Alkalihalobacillus algicola]MCA0985710.1 hypothetical protein [Alkalihalobacillus algicola]
MYMLMRYLIEHKVLTISMGIISMVIGIILQEFFLKFEAYILNNTLTIFFMGIGFSLLSLTILGEKEDKISVVAIKSFSLFFLIILVSSILTKMNVSNDSWIRSILIVSAGFLLFLKVKK